jgi:hypothetical protein
MIKGRDEKMDENVLRYEIESVGIAGANVFFTECNLICKKFE